MAPIATQPNDDDVTRFLESVADDRRRSDALAVSDLIGRVTGAAPRMWGSAIVGFGEGSYTNSSGTHDWFVVGFSPRKQATVLYGVLDDEPDLADLLDALGRHSTGKGCLYVPKLDAVDAGVLEQVVRRGWEHGAPST